MKKLLLLLLLCLLPLSGCMASESDYYVLTNTLTLKFKAGDEVKATGFYSNCDGTIVDTLNYSDTRRSPRYTVSFYCPNVGWLKQDQVIEENSLKKKEK